MAIDYARPQEFVFAVIEALPTGKEDGALTVREALILSYIGMRANRYGTCYPGNETIARQTRTSKSTVSKVLNKLERMGVLRRETKMRQGRGRRPDTIVLNLKDKRLEMPKQGEVLVDDQGEVLPAARWRSDSQQGEVETNGTSKGKGQPRKGQQNNSASVVDGHPVEDHHLALAEAAIGAFNERSGSGLKLLTSTGKPTEALKRIVMRLRESRDLTAKQIVGIINRNFDNPWWKGEAGIGVIFGPNVWDKAMANDGVPDSGRTVRRGIDTPGRRKKEPTW